MSAPGRTRLCALLAGSLVSLSLALSLAPARAAESDVASVLADSRYEFCHGDWRVGLADADLCRFALEPMPACPGFVRACASALLPQSDDRPAPPERRPLQIPGISGLFWILLGAGALWLVLQIVRNLQLASDDADADATEPEPGAAAPAAAPRRLVDADALRLLNAARAAATAGDLVRATELAHAALIRALESGGHVRVDPCMSNGDYSRALAAAPELREVFRSVAREVERSEFGGHVPTPDAVQQLFSRVAPIVERLVALLLVVAALSATGCHSAGPRGGLGDDSPAGGSVFRRLLEQAGARVQRRVSPLSELGSQDVELLIVAPSARLVAEDWLWLQSWVSDGGSLLLSGVPTDIPDELGVKRSFARCSGPALLVAADLVPGGARLVGLRYPAALDENWHFDVACAGQPLIATRAFDEGRLLLISESDFLSNASLAAGDHARVLQAMLGELHSVQIIDNVTGGGAESPYRAIANSGLGPLLGHGLGWLVLWALAAGTRFGTPRDPLDPPRRAFAEHVRAVGRSYARAGASRHALGLYAAWALDRLHARLLPGRVVGGMDLASSIARATGRPEVEVSSVISAAAAARDAPQGPNEPAHDLARVSALADLVRETGGTR